MGFHNVKDGKWPLKSIKQEDFVQKPLLYSVKKTNWKTSSKYISNICLKLKNVYQQPQSWNSRPKVLWSRTRGVWQARALPHTTPAGSTETTRERRRADGGPKDALGDRAINGSPPRSISWLRDHRRRKMVTRNNIEKSLYKVVCQFIVTQHRGKWLI